MCGRRCVYRAFDGACCYHAIEGKSRIAQIYKELGVTKVTDEVRERLRPKNCRFYEHGRSRAEKKQMLLPGSNGRRPCKMDAHEAEARRLYDEGKTDREIGDAVGVKASTVFRWRRDNGLPTKYQP